MVWGKWLMDQMWACYINKNHTLSDYSRVHTVMFHHSVSCDTTLRQINPDGHVNDKGVYHHFLTGNNNYTLHCYHICKTSEARNDHKVKTGCFWSKRLYNTFTQKFGLEMQFESSEDESDTKDDKTTNNNIKEGVNDGNGKVAESDIDAVTIC